MNGANIELQGVMDYLNEKLQRVPGGISNTSDDYIQSYVLGEFKGPLGFTMDLDISYEDAIAKSQGYSPLTQVPRLDRPDFIQEGLENSDLVARLQLRINPLSEGMHNLNEYDKYILGGYDVVGDSVVEVTHNAWKNPEVAEKLDKVIPIRFRKGISDIAESADARRVIDLGFQLYEWDNSM
jgi:hypothetical protein